MPSSGTKHTAKQQTNLFLANPQQAAAIAHSTGPAAFIAAAGTGKTSILVQRLVRLIADERVAPETILCVTFTRAAANEMEKRALKALKARGIAAKDVKGLRVVTFHGLGHQMLREKLQWTPQELNQRLISGEPRQWLAEDILRPWRSNRTRGMNWEVKILDVLGAVDRAKEAMFSAEQSATFFRSEMSLDTELAGRYQEFFVLYEQTKHKEKLYDLSDLIYVPLNLLQSSPTFRKNWQGRYMYLQVDETQDTNPSQYQLIQYLAAPKQNVVVVGDPDQAIYQFRGASPEASILSFRTMYPKGVIYRIEHNYRSTPQILEAANRLISQNETTQGFEKMLRATRPDGAPIQVTAYEDQESEANGIATRIAELVRTWREQKTDLTPLTYSDIFVLSRTNYHLASLEIALARNGVPYRTVGGSSFFKRRTTRDMLAYLALVDGERTYQNYLVARGGPQPPKWDELFTPIFCGEQNMAFRAVANIPSKEYFTRTGKTSHRFTPTLLGTLSAQAGGRPLLQFCEENSYMVPKEYQPGIKDFVTFIKQVQVGCNNSPFEAIRLLRQLAYDIHLHHADSKHPEGEEDERETPIHHEETKLEGRFDELEELMQIARRYHTIRHFLDGMTRLKEQAEDSSKNKRDCVSLMTVHKAKGLESPVVFVMGLTEGIFPHRRSYTMAEDGPIVLSGIAEERRLAYVAFTRAQQLLFLSSILRYRGSDAVASRFIQEAGLTPTDEDGVLNPYLFSRDGSPKRLSSLVTTPILFE